VATATLTAAQIRNLNATPKQLLASPGAGKGYMVLGVETQALPSTTPFGVPANARLSAGGLNQVLNDYSSWETGRFDQGASTATLYALNGTLSSENMSLFVSSQPPATPGVFPPALIANQPLVIGNTGHDFTGGAILAATLANGGSGYANGDEFTIGFAGPTSGGPAHGIVDTVDGGGAVLTFHISAAGDPGSPYFSDYGNPYSTTKLGGGGDDLLTITVTSTGQGNGQLVASIAYAIIAVT
jgi:hypothetical protein